MSDEDLNADLDADLNDDIATDTNDDTADDTSNEEESAALKQKNKQLFERAKKAEAELKKFKNQPEKKVEDNKPNNQSLTRDEAIFFAKFGSNENAEQLFEQLSVIAKGKGISIKEAQEDPLYKAFKAQADEEKRKKDASMPPSGGKGVTPAKPVSEMTDVEHKAYFEEVLKQNS
jgi:hypothetical protein